MNKGFYVFEPMVVLITAMILISVVTVAVKPKIDVLKEPPIGIESIKLTEASLDAEHRQVFLETAAEVAAKNAVFDLYDGIAGGNPCFESRAPVKQKMSAKPSDAFVTYFSLRIDNLIGSGFEQIKYSLLKDGIVGVSTKDKRYEIRNDVVNMDVLRGYYEFRHSFFVKLDDIIAPFEKAELLKDGLLQCRGRKGPDLDVCASEIVEKEGASFVSADESRITVKIDGPKINGCVRDPELIISLPLIET